MKRLPLILTLFVLLFLVLPTLAQDSADLILLDDTTPSVDVMIDLPANTTGTISLDITSAVVELRDFNNEIVFFAADARLHGIELNIAPNTGTHTLTVSRMPNAANAYARVTALSELTMTGTPQLIDNPVLAMNQEVGLSLNADNQAGMVSLSIPSETVGVVTATFPGTNATTQFVDNTGAVLAQSTNGHIDGMTFVLDGGEYGFMLSASNLTDAVIAGVRVVSAEDNGIVVLEAPENNQASADTMPMLESCTATILSSSINLRSGPGTGYSVLDYSYRGDVLPVGGQNPENNWIVVGTSDGNSAWVSKSVTNMNGACNELTVFNIPFRDAPTAQIIITSPTVGNGQSNYNSSEYYEDDVDDHEYEDDDDDHYEHHEDDDDDYEHDEEEDD